MSLINKMLRDLDARKSAAELDRPSQRMLHGLYPSGAVGRQRARRRLWSLLAVLTLLVALVFAWLQWGAGIESAYTELARSLDATVARVTGAGRVPAPTPATAPAEPEDVASAAAGATAAGEATPAAPADTAASEVAPEPAAVASIASPGPPRIEKKVRRESVPDTAEAAYRDAATKLRQGRVREAERGLLAALNQEPLHVGARELLLGIMLQEGRWSEGQQLLEQGLALVPDHYPFARLAARIYIEQGNDAKALAVLEGARVYAGGDPEYLAFLGTLYQRQRRHAEATKAYRDALALRPQEGKWWLGLALSLEATEDWGPARDAYTRARGGERLDPKLERYIEQRMAAIKNK